VSIAAHTVQFGAQRVTFDRMSPSHREHAGVLHPQAPQFGAQRVAFDLERTTESDEAALGFDTPLQRFHPT
jgi:hypothetical protein